MKYLVNIGSCWTVPLLIEHATDTIDRWMAAGHSSPVHFLSNSKDAVDVEGGDDFDEDFPPIYTTNPFNAKVETPFDENMTSPVRSDLRLERSLQNVTRESGESVKMRCDVRSEGPVHFRWYKNEAPVEEERGRVEIKRYTPGPGRIGSRLRIAHLDIHDTGYYKCEAHSGGEDSLADDSGSPRHLPRVESTGILIVRAGRIQPPATIPDFPPVFPHFPALGGT
ncbi:ig-like domain-containing protein [Caerostris darwini]|uniref:Ig-like domain-containing protein n=1 Tax=Caerostris darwini TaxID=1538125 RepID=A0AAV4R4U4_9ARAC|nr:ig-like domain-containing protein [Caerostris darwini]